MDRKSIADLFQTKPSEQELAIFCQQFGTLLASGLEIPEALQLLSEGVKKRSFKKDIVQVSILIRQGYALSEATATCPKSFPDLFTEMIGAAERAVGLTEVLDRLSEYYDRQAALHSQLLQVTLYPIIILILSVVVLTILLVKVVPLFVDIIESMNGSVPVATRILVGIGNGVAKGWPVILLLAIIGWAVCKLLAQKENAADFFGKLSLHLPVMGDFILSNNCMQFAQTLSILLKGGVDLPEALQVCQAITQNGAIKNALANSCEAIVQGQPLYESMEATGIFPAELNRMIRVGEETGELKTTMDRIADYYLKKFTRKTKMLMTILEPAVLIVVGVMVLLVLFAVMQPIYQVYELYTVAV